MHFRLTALIAGGVLLCAAPFAGHAAAQDSTPSIHLMVDASTAPQKFSTRGWKSPYSGPLSLCYPEWIQRHMPDGPIMISPAL